MSSATITTVKHIANKLEAENEFDIQVNLEKILVEEFKTGLPIDIYLGM